MAVQPTDQTGYVAAIIDDSMAVLPRALRAQRIATLISVMVPFLGFAAAIVCLWGWAFTWVELTGLVGMYLLTGLGVTVGFHRLFTHRAFETGRPVRYLLAVLGSMTVQGPVLKWAAIHRRHHQFSDLPDDPHSPYHFGGGAGGVFAGLWHAHVGWMFKPTDMNLDSYVRDLEDDRLVRHVSQWFLVWVALGLMIPAVFGGLVTGTWSGTLLGFLWGGLARIFIVQHLTFSVNSVCHVWGTRPFECKDESRNNFICGVLGFGEGWHNNHHAFPASARHGLRWWEFDLSYVTVRVMQWLGLVWGVRLPSRKAMASKRVGAHTKKEPSAPLQPPKTLAPKALDANLL